MPSVSVLRKRIGISKSYRPNQVITKAIRAYSVGGDALIDALTLTHQLSIGHYSGDPQIVKLFRQLKTVREAMMHDILDKP